VNRPRISVLVQKERRMKPAIVSLLLVAIAGGAASANTVSIQKAIKQTPVIRMTGMEIIDFSGTGYRVRGAAPKDPSVLRAVTPPTGSQYQTLLIFTPNSEVKQTEIVIFLSAPGKEDVNLGLIIVREKDRQMTTSFIDQTVIANSAPEPQPRPQLTVPDVSLSRMPGSRLQSKRQPRPIQTRIPIRVPTPKPVNLPTRIALKSKPMPKTMSPKPKAKTPLLSVAGLQPNPELNGYQLAHCLRRGLNKAKKENQLNRSSNVYWYTQSMIRSLNRRNSVPYSLRISKLPKQTYVNLLGHGGCAK